MAFILEFFFLLCAVILNELSSHSLNLIKQKDIKISLQPW